MEIEGVIIQDLPLQSGTSKAGNAWKKKEWVLETLGSYPRKVKFDFFGDRVDRFPLQVGKTYVISYDLESREFNGRWYTDVRAFDAREQGAPVQNQSAVQQPSFNQPGTFSQPSTIGEPGATFPGNAAEGTDDLPF